MIGRRSLLAGAAAFPFAAAARALAADAAVSDRPGIDLLFRPSALLDVCFSPSGEKLALMLDAGRGDEPDLKIEIVSAADPARGATRLAVGAVRPRWLAWAGEARLLLGAAEPSKLTVTDSSSRGSSVTLDLDYRRVLSLPLDGSEPVVLFTESRFRKVMNLAELVAVIDERTALFAGLDPTGRSSGASMMENFSTQANEMDLARVALFRADLTTGSVERVDAGTTATRRWEGRSERVVLRRDIDVGAPSKEAWFAPFGDGGAWKAVQPPAGAAFLAVADGDHAVWIDGPSGLQRWDLAGGAVEPPISRPGRRIEHVVFDPAGRVLFTQYGADRGQAEDFDAADPALGSELKGVAAYVGAGARVRLLDIAADGRRLLIAGALPGRPAAALLYDRTARRVTELASTAPRLNPERLATPRPAGRNALIPPPGGGPGPLVVVFDAGRPDRWLEAFDPWVQAFVGKGWWSLLTSDGMGADAVGLGQLAAAHGLDGRRICGLGVGPLAATARDRAVQTGWRGVVTVEDPDPVADPGDDFSRESQVGTTRVLALGPPPPRPLRGASAALVRTVFARDGIGGDASVAEAIAGRPDRRWDLPSTRTAAAGRAIAFLERMFAAP
jgi:dipeptidyl aminopeptidase/acylaminoacyl peptidase